jgi:hypothetical protein
MTNSEKPEHLDDFPVDGQGLPTSDAAYKVILFFFSQSPPKSCRNGGRISTSLAVRSRADTLPPIAASRPNDPGSTWKRAVSLRHQLAEFTASRTCRAIVGRLSGVSR